MTHSSKVEDSNLHSSIDCIKKKMDHDFLINHVSMHKHDFLTLHFQHDISIRLTHQ